MDFFKIKERLNKNGSIEIQPDFIVCRSKDLMIRGKSFYAVWDESTGLWSTDEYDVRRLVDEELYKYRDEHTTPETPIKVKAMGDYSSNTWRTFRDYMSHLSDNYHQIDALLTFQNTATAKKDYVSKKLPYSLLDGNISAYEELISTLYEPEERQKIEWAIGAVISGDARTIQKFLVFYGEGGTGKSTILNIIQKLFIGYYTTFEAKALTSHSNGFSTEVFRSNPLVAIQHDGDLSRIEDNTKLNSIISHEEMVMNEKYKPSYTARANCFLFMATNKPVKITDAKSGIIRRLIDVRPSGNKIETRRYFELTAQVDFELGAIASHCLKVYQSLGKNYYMAYRPIDMMYQTDVFFNFVEEHISLFENGVTLSQAYSAYKAYCDDATVDFKLPKYKFRDELKNYFSVFSPVTRIDGKQVRSYYSGLLKDKFILTVTSKEPVDTKPGWLVLDKPSSIYDKYAESCKAQLANSAGFPKIKWSEVTTSLKDIDTQLLHYIKVADNEIVIDFDLKDDQGNKSLVRNIEAASMWPPTYAELSKSGAGIHLHYTYAGDRSKLSPIISEGIELLRFPGDMSLRRKLTYCNSLPVNQINSGLPILQEKKVINFDAIKNERAIRTLIERNLTKTYHAGTKPSVDFIFKILEDAYNSGVKYDVSDMFTRVMVFANNSTNHSQECMSLVSKMHFRSDEPNQAVDDYFDDRLVFFDVEVFPNILIVCWKYQGVDGCVSMIDPSSKDIGDLMKMKLVGFNCRRYDNHILYARYIGKSVEEIYEISKRIVEDRPGALFGEAYSISYADVYDFSTIKQSLKKFQIELGIHHKELGIPWDKPLPEDQVENAVKYCENDVVTLEQVFDSRKEDYIARQILSDLSGLPVNATTQQHTGKIIFAGNPKPKLVYTDLSETFPGYRFDSGKSFYRGEEPGEGGYVYAEPGYYTNVALLDVASMHPTSIEVLNLFGGYTKNYSAIKQARLKIKRGQLEEARKMLDGKLEKYLGNPKEADALAYALKIAINIVYGLTSASFSNVFRDPRNKDNIVAKRGALFMIDLKHEVQSRGYKVAHIKTDSIKIPNADDDIISFVREYGRKYGYDFEHEATYDRFCLVNDAVYVARYSSDHKKKPLKWTATGAQFSHPYIFKKLFSKEEILFNDLCETKSVSSYMYLDMNEPDQSAHNYIFVGKVGAFCPIIPGAGGGILLREKDGKYHAVTGTKGHRWLESELVRNLGLEDKIDMSYFENLLDDAVDTLSKWVDPQILIG